MGRANQSTSLMGEFDGAAKALKQQLSGSQTETDSKHTRCC